MPSLLPVLSPTQSEATLRPFARLSAPAKENATRRDSRYKARRFSSPSRMASQRVDEERNDLVVDKGVRRRSWEVKCSRQWQTKHGSS